MRRISRTGIRASGFTFFEILVATGILAFGITAIFRIYLTTFSASQYLYDRLEAHRIAEDAIWKAKSIIQNRTIVGSYSESADSGHNGKYNMKFMLGKRSDANQLYELDLTVSWVSEGKERSMKRMLLLRKGV